MPGVGSWRRMAGRVVSPARPSTTRSCHEVRSDRVSGELDIDGLPLEFWSSRRWCVWKLEVGEKGKPKKVPYRVDLTRRASCTEPGDWSDVEPAIDAVDIGRADGIGYALEPGLTLVDLDDVTNGAG